MYSLCNHSLYEPHLPYRRLGFRTKSLHSRVINRVELLRLPQSCKYKSSRARKFAIPSVAESVGLSRTVEKPETDTVESVGPVYEPTPPNRDLRTPHSG